MPTHLFDGNHLIEALKILSKDSLSNLTPPSKICLVALLSPYSDRKNKSITIVIIFLVKF